MKDNDLPFIQDQQGNYLFYPWGIPGEAFYATPKTMKILVLSFVGLALLFALSVAITIYLREVTSITTSAMNYCWGGISAVVPLAYITIIKISSYKANFVRSEEGIRTPKKGVLVLGAFILAWQIIAILTALDDPSLSTLSMLAIVICLFLTSILNAYAFWKIHSSRGYLLT